MAREPTAAVTVRPAELDDHDAVASFTRDTWAAHDAGDYVPRVFEEWVRTDGDRQRTLVAEVDGAVVGVVQVVVLSDWEAWGQGIRVHPEFRGEGVANALTRACFDWARDRGATVQRAMVFSWNVMGLGQARASGYEPVAEFRWVHPEPDPDAAPGDGSDGSVVAAVTGGTGDRVGSSDPDAAWRFWTGSDARTTLSGLVLAADESWALAELTRQRLAEAADAGDLLVVRNASGTRGFALHGRDYDREDDDGVERTWAVYAVAAWRDADAARAVLAAVARDAARRGADRTRVLIPEDPRVVSDAALARVEVDGEPDFVLAADLTADLPVDDA